MSVSNPGSPELFSHRQMANAAHLVSAQIKGSKENIKSLAETIQKNPQIYLEVKKIVDLVLPKLDIAKESRVEYEKSLKKLTKIVAQNLVSTAKKVELVSSNVILSNQAFASPGDKFYVDYIKSKLEKSELNRYLDGEKAGVNRLQLNKHAEENIQGPLEELKTVRDQKLKPTKTIKLLNILQADKNAIIKQISGLENELKNLSSNESDKRIEILNKGLEKIFLYREAEAKFKEKLSFLSTNEGKKFESEEDGISLDNPFLMWEKAQKLLQEIRQIESHSYLNMAKLTSTDSIGKERQYYKTQEEFFKSQTKSLIDKSLDEIRSMIKTNPQIRIELKTVDIEQLTNFSKFIVDLAVAVKMVKYGKETKLDKATLLEKVDQLKEIAMIYGRENDKKVDDLIEHMKEQINS